MRRERHQDLFPTVEPAQPPAGLLGRRGGRVRSG